MEKRETSTAFDSPASFIKTPPGRATAVTLVPGVQLYRDGYDFVVYKSVFSD